MEGIVNVPYEGIGFNGNELSRMNPTDFSNEVKHHFNGDPKAADKIKELYTLIHEIFPGQPDEKPAPAILPLKTVEVEAK